MAEMFRAFSSQAYTSSCRQLLECFSFCSTDALHGLIHMTVRLPPRQLSLCPCLEPLPDHRVPKRHSKLERALWPKTERPGEDAEATGSRHQAKSFMAGTAPSLSCNHGNHTRCGSERIAGTAKSYCLPPANAPFQPGCHRSKVCPDYGLSCNAESQMQKGRKSNNKK